MKINTTEDSYVITATKEEIKESFSCSQSLKDFINAVFSFIEDDMRMRGEI